MHLACASIPFLFFLLIYSSNPHTHLLPTFHDLPTTSLLNISTIDSFIFISSSPQQFISSLHHPFLDLLSAIPYLLHYPLPFLAPIAFLRTPPLLAHLFLLLGASMWVNYSIWLILPSAPPWLEGPFTALSNHAPTAWIHQPTFLTPPGCAFHRIDQSTGLYFFRFLFSNNPVPFGSLPSGHVTWPCCVLMTSWRSRRRVLTWLLFAHVIWVSWATLYTCHHYASDVISAILIVLAAHWFVRKHSAANQKRPLLSY